MEASEFLDRDIVDVVIEPDAVGTVKEADRKEASTSYRRSIFMSLGSNN